MRYVDEAEKADKPGIIHASGLKLAMTKSQKKLQEVKEQHKSMVLRTVVIDRKTTIQTTSTLSDQEIRENFIKQTNYFPL